MGPPSLTLRLKVLSIVFVRQFFGTVVVEPIIKKGIGKGRKRNGKEGGKEGERNGKEGERN